MLFLFTLYEQIPPTAWSHCIRFNLCNIRIQSSTDNSLHKLFISWNYKNFKIRKTGKIRNKTSFIHNRTKIFKCPFMILFFISVCISYISEGTEYGDIPEFLLPWISLGFGEPRNFMSNNISANCLLMFFSICSWQHI